MTRRLAWAAGASCGLIVGYLYGTVTLDWLSWRAVRRSQPRRAVPASTEPREVVYGPQEDTWGLGQAALHARLDYQEALRRAEGMPWEPGVDLAEWHAEHHLPFPMQRAVEMPRWVPDEPCPITLGPLTCPFRGPHTSHAFQSGTWAPDRKDDADERIE